MKPTFRKILVVGAGPVVIGQSSESDYAGTQMCRTLKNEGIEVVVVNSNPATVMTDKQLVDKVYIEPLNGETVKKLLSWNSRTACLQPPAVKPGLKSVWNLRKTAIWMSTTRCFFGRTAGRD